MITAHTRAAFTQGAPKNLTAAMQSRIAIATIKPSTPSADRTSIQYSCFLVVMFAIRFIGFSSVLLLDSSMVYMYTGVKRFFAALSIVSLKPTQPNLGKYAPG